MKNIKSSQGSNRINRVSKDNMIEGLFKNKSLTLKDVFSIRALMRDLNNLDKRQGLF